MMLKINESIIGFIRKVKLKNILLKYIRGLSQIECKWHFSLRIDLTRLATMMCNLLYGYVYSIFFTVNKSQFGFCKNALLHNRIKNLI